jgi:hypothetical protein
MPIIVLGISVAIANPEEVFELLVDAIAGVVEALVLLVFVPVTIVVNALALPVVDPVPVLEPFPVPTVFPEIVVTPTTRLPLATPVVVITLGAPEILPTLTAPLNSETLLSRLAILALYWVGTAVSQSGGVLAVKAEAKIWVMSPVRV